MFTKTVNLSLYDAMIYCNAILKAVKLLYQVFHGNEKKSS